MTPIEVASTLADLPKDQIPALVAALLAQLIEPKPETTNAPLEEDPLLTADQVAERLQVNRKWVYRHKDKLGAVRLSRKASLPLLRGRCVSSETEGRFLRKEEVSHGKLQG